MRGKKVKCAKCASPIDTDTCEISESNKVVTASPAPSVSSGNSQNIEVFQSKLDEHDVDLAVLLERVEELDNKFEHIDIASEIETKLLSVNGKLAALEEELHDMHTQQSSSDVSGGSVDSHALDEVKESIANLESKIEELGEQRSEAPQQQGSSEDVEELKSRIESLEAKLALQSKQSVAPADSGVSTTVDVLKLSVKGLETKISDFSKQMQKMQDLLSSINSKQSSIEQQLEANEEKIGQLEGNSHSTLMPNNVTSKPNKTEIVLEETGLDEEVETVKPTPHKVSHDDATLEEIHFEEEEEEENSITSNSSADEIIIDQGDEEKTDGGSHEVLEVESSATDEEVVYDEVEEEDTDVHEETEYDEIEETVKEETAVEEEVVEEVEEEVVEEEVVEEEVEEEVVEEVEEEVVEEEVVEEEVEEEVVEEVEEEVVEEEVEEEVVEEEVVVDEPEAGEATVPMPEQPPLEDDKKKKGRSRRGKDASDKAASAEAEPKKKGFFARLFGKK